MSNSATQKMEETIAKHSTETLLDIARKLNLKTSAEEICVVTYVERELEKSLPEAEFLALMEELEAELDAA